MTVAARDHQAAGQIAQQLLTARRERLPMAPISRAHPTLDIDDAYSIQSCQVDQWLLEGDTIAGFKIGLVAEAMQQQMGVHEPDFGHVMTSSIHQPPTELDRARYVAPLVEPELGVVLAADLPGTGVTADAVLAATAYVVPLIEVVDSRIRNWDLTIVDTVADNASSGGVHLGTSRHSPERITLSEVTCALLVNGVERAGGTGRDVLGHPAAAVAWLANELGRRGVRLRAGQLILSGAMTRAVRVDAGDSIRADFGQLGTVRLPVTRSAATPPHDIAFDAEAKKGSGS
ncbi:fumarylacetoacetate hydrolase family protein [Kribbella sp. NBC_00709]|uniref:2-keto-4-pentenoate hydratase n=1 Tax=Kribbella sp. NBC_00709 TaxID=2975972 RepID=UPI002E2BAA2F|nr:fumarylacetoacetate hydrolase family protein [Kribbella sp. NBC_00709]